MVDDKPVATEHSDDKEFRTPNDNGEKKKSSRRSELMFRVMLWSLGIAAVCGVGAVLTASFAVVGRVVGTAMLTAGVSAALWQSIDQLELKRASIRRLVDVASAGFYLFCLLAIWGIGNEPKMWGTAIAIFAGFYQATGGLWLAERHDRRISGLLLAVLSIPSFMCWLIAIWLDLSKSMEIFFVGTTLTAWTIAASACLFGHTFDSKHQWRWLGVAAAALGYGLTVVLIFEGYPTTTWLEKLTFLIGSICAIVLHANLLLLAKLGNEQKWLRPAVIAVAVGCVCCVDTLVITEASGTGLLVRITIALAIVASAGTIAIAYIGRRNTRLKKMPSEPVTASEPTLSAVDVRCPRCGLQQSLSLGRSECQSCKLGFKIQLIDST